MGPGALEQFEQALQILQLDRWPRRLAQTAAQLLQDLAGTLHVDLVWHLDADPRVGSIRALRRSAERVKFAAIVVQAEARRHLVQHLLGHLPRPLAQLLERPALLLGAAVEITIAQGALGPFHGLAGAAELFRRIEPELAQTTLQPAQHVAQLTLAVAETGELVAFALLPPTLALLALLAALAALALLPLLALLALLAPLSALALLALLALLTLLAEGVVEQLLLATDDVAELIHHLAELTALALVSHAPGLQAVKQVAQLRQHLLGHVAIARTRHVFQVAQQLIQILGRHELTVAVEALHRRLVLRLLLQLLEELRQRLSQLLHQALDFLIRGALFQRLRQALLRRPQRPLGVGQIAVLDA